MKKVAVIFGALAVVVLTCSFATATTTTPTQKHATIEKDAAHGGAIRVSHFGW